MFSSSVWVLVLVLSNGATAVPVGTFSSKEACVKATKEAVTAIAGESQNSGMPGWCVPVEKPIK